MLCLCTGFFFVQSCGHPSLTGLTCFVRGFISKVVYAPAYLAGYASYGDFGPKLLIPQPNWSDMFCTGIFVQGCGHPSLTGLIYSCTGIYVQSCGHPSLTGLIYLCTGICVQRCGLPCLTGSIYLCTGICVQSCGLPCLTGITCLYMMIFV